MDGIKDGHINGFWFGYSNCIRFVFIGVVFYISAVFISKKQDNPQDSYVGVFVLFVVALGSGTALSKAPSIAKAREAARTVFEIIDEPSTIDTRSDKGEKVIHKGEIEYVNAEFQYPSRALKVLD